MSVETFKVGSIGSWFGSNPALLLMAAGMACTDGQLTRRLFMGMKSKRKGKSGERDCAKYLTSLGFTARRGVQYSGGSDSPDVLCELLPHVHLEVKRDESIGLGTKALESACSQAMADAGEKKRWAVLWRRNRSPWAMTFYGGELLGIVTACGDVGIRVALNGLNGIVQEVK